MMGPTPEFLQTSALGLTGAAFGQAQEYNRDKQRRVGLIGCGWYGKIDLFRLIQVAPVEVVSLCDVDQHMLAECRRDGRPRGRNRRRSREPIRDYRKMLAEKDLDIVLIATPDHWHALTMIEAVEIRRRRLCAEADQRRRHRRQGDARRRARSTTAWCRSGLQRRSTPHLVEAATASSTKASSARSRWSKFIATTTCARPRTRPIPLRPPNLDYEMWTGPAPMRPYNTLVHPRSWRAFMEYGNGIVGDMCVHMLDMTRWMLDLGWPTRVASTGGILVDKQSKANISDTQTATFDFDDLRVVWQHRTWGESADPKYPWGATFYGDKGTLKAASTATTLHRKAAANPCIAT